MDSNDGREFENSIQVIEQILKNRTIEKQLFEVFQKSLRRISVLYMKLNVINPEDGDDLRRVINQLEHVYITAIKDEYYRKNDGKEAVISDSMRWLQNSYKLLCEANHRNNVPLDEMTNYQDKNVNPERDSMIHRGSYDMTGEEPPFGLNKQSITFGTDNDDESPGEPISKEPDVKQSTKSNDENKNVRSEEELSTNRTIHYLSNKQETGTAQYNGLNKQSIIFGADNDDESPGESISKEPDVKQSTKSNDENKNPTAHEELSTNRTIDRLDKQEAGTAQSKDESDANQTAVNRKLETELQSINASINLILRSGDGYLAINKRLIELQQENDLKNREIFELKEQNMKHEQAQYRAKLAQEQLKAELTERAKRIQDRDQEMADLRKQISDADKIRFKLEFIKSELHKKEDVVRTLRIELATKDSENGRLILEGETNKLSAENEIQRRKEINKELEACKSGEAELQIKLNTKSDELLSTMKELTKCKGGLIGQLAINKNLDKKYEEAANNLKQNDKNHREEINLLQVKLQRQAKEFVSLNEYLTEKKKELEEERKTCMLLDASYADLQKELNETSAELRSKMKKIDDCQLEIDGRQKRTDELTDEINQANRTIQQLSEAIKKKEEEATTHYRNYCDENEENAKLKEAFEFYQSEQIEEIGKLKSLLDETFKVKSVEEIRARKSENVKRDLFAKLHLIALEVESHEASVREFYGDGKSKKYLHIQELIQRSIGNIDRISTQDDEVKQKKGQLIKRCQKLDDELQEKVG